MTLPPFLLRLMLVPRLGIKLTRPEDVACAAFAAELRGAVIEGRLSCVFTHVSNEIGWQDSVKEKRKAQLAYAIAKALGFTPGTADYLFLWEGGSGAIEFKSGSGRQSDVQKDFQKWCEARGVPYAVARSPEQGLDILRQWGVLS